MTKSQYATLMENEIVTFRKNNLESFSPSSSIVIKIKEYLPLLRENYKNAVIVNTIKLGKEIGYKSLFFGLIKRRILNDEEAVQYLNNQGLYNFDKILDSFDYKCEDFSKFIEEWLELNSTGWLGYTNHSLNSYIIYFIEIEQYIGTNYLQNLVGFKEEVITGPENWVKEQIQKQSSQDTPLKYMYQGVDEEGTTSLLVECETHIDEVYNKLSQTHDVQKLTDKILKLSIKQEDLIEDNN